jgi:hypothetical protein
MANPQIIAKWLTIGRQWRSNPIRFYVGVLDDQIVQADMAMSLLSITA